MTHSTIVRCVSWVAVSSEQQADEDKESLPQQRKLNRDFIDNLSSYYPNVEGVFIEELSVVGSRSIVQFSTAIETYPAYKRLDEMIRRREFDLLVCRNRSRLGREDSLIVTIETLCEKSGIAVAARDSLPRSVDVRNRDEGQRIISLLQSHLASAEIREMVRRRDEGMQRRVQTDGKFPARVPYGWTLFYDPSGTQHIVKDETAASILRTILLEWYVKQGYSLRQLVDEANAMGWPSPSGDEWTVGGIHDVVRYAYRYASYIVYNRRSRRNKTIMSKGEHEEIISDGELKRVQDEYQRRTFKKVTQDRLFTGIVICGTCGNPLRNNTTQFRLADGSVKKHNRLQCDVKGCQGTILDETVYEAIRSSIIWLQNDAAIEKLLDEIPEQETDSIQSQAEAVEKRIEELIAGRERIKRSYFSMGVLSDAEFAAEMEANAATMRHLHTELAELQAQLSDVREQVNHRERLEQIRNTGLDILAQGEDNPKYVNQWLRQNFRVHVKLGRLHARGGGMVVSHVDFFD